MAKQLGKQTSRLSRPPRVESCAACVGKKEGAGPLGSLFDDVHTDDTLGEKNWEKAESALFSGAVNRCLEKAALTPDDVRFLLGGDLLNQLAASCFACRDLGIPFLGLFGACSTMAESLAVGSLLLDGGNADRLVCAASSHFCTAERQFRFPLELGTQRPPSAQWTVTGAGAVILGRDGDGPYLRCGTVGTVVDKGIKDANNMGAAMAPAAYETLRAHFDDMALAPEDYDLIVTGDLGLLGSQIVRELFEKDGVRLGERYNDCGVMIFDTKKQDVHCGGSGCGCSASVLCGLLLGQMQRRELRRLLFCGTGALLSPLSTQQGESIPAVCHAVSICTERE